MVVLAASICTKGGKAVISRQFRDMARMRIESLLASFPKLIPIGTQHTTVETSDVRYVYQPLEDLYIVLITNKASNILQDIDTLHLFARIVSDLCRSADEREILKNSFELLGAFDEVVSLGYKEGVNLMQVRSILEMESHEEKIQEIIARNKEAEAKEELKRRAKQLEMQRREQQRRAQGGGGGSYMGMGGGVTGYSPVPQRFDVPETVTPARNSSPAPSSLRPPAFKGSGMKLGAKKKDQLADALGGEIHESESPVPSAPGTPLPSAQADLARPKGYRGSIPPVTPDSIHIAIKEQISASLMREGGLTSLELKGDMNLTVAEASRAKIKLTLAPATTDFGADLQFKQHPNVAKFGEPGTDRTIALKDPSKSFPVNRALEVLRWRYTGRDESLVPLSINCWPTPSNDGTCDVNIEYELENDVLSLHDVLISIPLPAGSYPTVSSHSGTWTLNASTHSLDWSIPLVTADERSGSLEFSVGGDDVDAFFPVKVAFVAEGSMAGVQVVSAHHAGTGAEETFSQDTILSSEEYIVA
ncbi:hypothetical protein PUNSTDRAFT_49151 [Punctularia strigosozonata HHB-11173 SS5]|uniref:uncharacterized protein n=1 Tax=Punctularia strigosozonata (strain HHB-11173) TaxID=741275 RepID=UPI00044165EB|nr:uncharacterized protein PUNSTDRAFT_49151 [Punctularia strigosozonata HHB-11173 SS5]EIN14331.1 hypothetical protein PUNSTDRAFT_49151 [Punctularia strigosozonata HHB-11173 SS5]